MDLTIDVGANLAPPASRTCRHTKIIATLGPATEPPEMLRELLLAGVSVIRLNMAHATGEWVHEVVHRIRTESHAVGRQVAVMMDVKGPEIRTGVVSAPIGLAAGDLFEFYTGSPQTPHRGVDVNYPGLPHDVAVGSTVLVDSGLIRMVVEAKTATSLLCRVTTPGKLGSKRHINLPNVDVNLPSLTEKDERDILVGVEAGCDFFALSFVRKGEDILALRRLLDELGSRARIIAKIEDQSGVRNLESIVTATHPDAKLRSFAGRAASFLSPTHLIIASYESSDHESMPVAPDGDVTVYDQRTLFTG